MLFTTSQTAPAFVSNDETLCIMDPHCRYVPGARTLRPGRRFDRLGEGFWEDFPDVKSAYLRHGLDDLPLELLSGSLFRFPLRHSRRKIALSEITEDPKSSLNANQLSVDLNKWMTSMKEAMLFLNNVSELKLLTIEATSRTMRTIYHFQSQKVTTSVNTTLLQSSLSTFKSREECKPCVVTYPLTLTEVGVGGQGKDTVEKWLIQQGVGDIGNSGQVWQYVDTVKPRHGIAAPLSTFTKREEFKGQVFCFLPLPVYSGLPVHVNGHFILNSTRRELWTSTDIYRVDDRSMWNESLVHALASSYAQFLCQARSHYVAREYQSVVTALNRIQHFYSLFPIFTNGNESLWNTLARGVYKSLLGNNYHILCVLQMRPNGDGCAIEWYSPKSSLPANHVYYWPSSNFSEYQHKRVYPILERLGMKITPASSQVMECFNMVQEVSDAFLCVTPRSLFDYYTKRSKMSSNSIMTPTRIESTPFQNVASFVFFTKYILENEPITVAYSSLTSYIVPKKRVYPGSPFSHYLLLTADGLLRRFEENLKVLHSSFSHLFPNTLQNFLHPKLLDVNYIRSYFIEPDDSKRGCVAALN